MITYYYVVFFPGKIIGYNKRANYCAVAIPTLNSLFSVSAYEGETDREDQPGLMP